MSLTLLLAGVVLTFGSATVFAAKAMGTETTAATFSTPGTHHVSLRAGSYDVLTEGNPKSLDERNVTVRDPSGAAMTLSKVTSAQSFSVGSVTYRASVMFKVSEPGIYSIDVRSATRYAAVAPDLQTVIRWNPAWLTTLLVGLVLGLAGLVSLAIRMVRRSQAKRRMNFTAPGIGYRSPPPWPASQNWPPPGMPPPGMAPPGMAPPGAPRPGMAPTGAPRPGMGPPGIAPPGAPPRPSDWSPQPTPRSAPRVDGGQADTGWDEPEQQDPGS
ncbi:MAG: hypothetical protein ACRD0Z_05485 [Acidimicrobiales bacterium]